MIVSATTQHAKPQAEREQLAGAAKAFEAIFVRQILAAARKTDFGGEMFGGQSLDTFRQMQDERFADLASQTGAFGIAKMIEAQLSVQSPPSGPSGEGL
jgi:flagellar protein FlgJ